MTEDRLVFLITGRWSGTLSLQERDEIARWGEEAPANQEFLDRMSDEDALLAKEIALWERLDPAGAYNNYILRRSAKRKSSLIRATAWVAAASLLIAVLGTSLFRRTTSLPPTASIPSPAPPAINPGRNTATLTLANGQKLLLDTANQGNLGKQGNADVVKVDNNTLAYSAASANASGAVAYNTLVTPRAAQFRVKLPDGTIVWLNNASSLRYPTVFTGGVRTVELTGEAYFDVARDAAKPFFVKTPGIMVQVLGTGFNLEAYTDEPNARITLVQGKINVKRGRQEAVLAPGQQVAAGQSGDWKVLSAVNTDAVIAWRDGLFDFDNADLHTALRQLARWYDVDIEFHGTIPDKRLQGQMQRNLTLNQVLEILQDKDVHFALDGRKLIVTP